MLFSKKESTLLEKSNSTDAAATTSPKRIKLSLSASSSIENPVNQDLLSFHQLANNTLLQKSIFNEFLLIQ